MNYWVAVVLVYLVGYIVTVVVAARNWFDRFDIEFEGVLWAMFVAVVWPLLTVPYAVFRVVSYRVRRRGGRVGYLHERSVYQGPKDRR